MTTLLWSAWSVKQRDHGAQNPDFEALHNRDGRGRFANQAGSGAAPKPRRAKLTAGQQGVLRTLADANGPVSSESLNGTTLRSLQTRGLVRVDSTEVSAGARTRVTRQITITDAGRAELGVPAKPATAPDLASTASGTVQTDNGGRITLEEAARIMYGTKPPAPKKKPAKKKPPKKKPDATAGPGTVQTDNGGRITQEEAARIMYGTAGKPTARKPTARRRS